MLEPSASGEPTGPTGDAALVAALRRGDEAAFAALVALHHAALLRLARLYVADPAAAEEVVQETWLALLEGLDRFEGRASLKTWLVRVLVNLARTRGERERRSLPFSAVWDAAAEPEEPARPPECFIPAGPLKGHWAAPRRSWGEAPEERLLAGELRRRIRAAIEALSPAQREVITLRDIEGWSSQEVCNALGISETNQRVLLHRARARVQRALEPYLDPE